VRFAWNELAMPNLVNAAGLPALPFRTDDWPVVLETPKPPKEATAK
jgi:sialate O-acetylesterase